MSLHSWLQNLRIALAPRRGQRKHARPGSLRAATHRINLEALEDRRLLAFLAPVDYAVGFNPLAMATADFTNDGRPDIAVVNYTEHTVSVLVGSAMVPGTFDPAVTSPTGAYPSSLAVGDFNDDGNLDVATASDQDVSVLLGDSTGVFVPAGSGMGFGSNPRSLAVGDFNGDGLLDLGLTSNVYHPGYYGYYYSRPAYFTSSAHVLLGDGAGGFSAPNSTTFVDYAPYNSALATDLNGDLYDDFVTLRIDGYVTVLLGDSSGFLQGPTGSFYTGGDYSYALAAADLDGDGDTDLVTANDGNSPSLTSNMGSVGVLLGDGSGGFSGPSNYATGGESYPSSIVLGDFTHDGNLDVATTNYYSGQLSVLHGRGDGTFSSPAVFATSSAPLAVAAGDFNGDGWLDAATANPVGEQHNVVVLINDQTWSEPPLPPSVSINDMTVTEGNTGSTNATFTVTLSAPSNQDVTVHYATANITAAAGSDYTTASGDVIIPAGQTSRTITVAVSGDRLPEATETVAVNLSNSTNATIDDGHAVGTIVDDEPRISISDAAKKEGKKDQTTQFTFVVELSAAYDQPVTLSFRTVNGTATTAGNDYVAKTGAITFAPGETRKEITITVKGDSKREANETFYLDLYGLSSNAVFTKNRGLGTILNDD